MQADKKKTNSNRTVRSDFTKDGKVISALNFLEKYLPLFPEKFVKNVTHDEWDLNLALFEFLNLNLGNYLFQLIPEQRNVNNGKPDFGVKEVKLDSVGSKFYDQKAEHFFDIECKRLNGKHYDYVSGNTGGIQRFKDNKHGVDLPQSAMIGYVETKSFSFWQNKVNSWISDKNEYLKLINIQKIAKYKSTHKRRFSTIDTIELLHYWINITTNF